MSPNLEAFRCSDDRLGFSHWVSFMVLGLSNGFTDPKQHGVIEVEITIVKMMMKYLMVIIHHCEDDDEFMVFPVSPFGDNPHQSSPCLFTMVCDPPQVTWRFFQEELPTTFFIRRLTRCRITRLASQCAKLVGESMPDGVDYQLQPELTEHILQVISHEFYQRPPQEFYQSRRPEDGCFEGFFK